jgi:hypothetical protein
LNIMARATRSEFSASLELQALPRAGADWRAPAPVRANRTQRQAASVHALAIMGTLGAIRAAARFIGLS